MATRSTPSIDTTLAIPIPKCRPTVLSILEEQMARHVIAVGGKVASEFGRQPVLYTLDRQTHFAIGIDFEFPPMRLCVADLAGQIRYEKQ